ncbi:MAG TPA: stage III sporulation protein AD [Clostridia bacterium]|nr:stage III sporulation protein AD [Clostridia bacterium]
MNMFQIAGIVITVAALAVLLRQYKQEYSLMLSLGAGILIFMLVISRAQPVFAQIQSLVSKSGINTGYLEVLMKALGICFITQFAADSCKDAGESAMASKVEMAGKFAVLLVSLPLFAQVAELAVSLMGN